MIAATLYLLGLGMSFYGFEETDEDGDRGMSIVLSFLWPVLAAGTIIYMIYTTLKK